MNNYKEEILRIATEKLENEVESIILDINISLDNVSGNSIEGLIEKLKSLSLAEASLNYSRNLYTQVIDNKKKREEQIKIADLSDKEKVKELLNIPKE